MIKIYTAVMKTKPLDLENNFKNACIEVENAIKENARLIIFPQTFLSGSQLGMMQDALYFSRLYNQYVKRLSEKYPNIYILADIYKNKSFKNILFYNNEEFDCDNFSIDEINFSSYSNAEILRNDCQNIKSDCVILNESSPVVAGSRTLLKKLLEAIHLGTGVTILCNLGGYGFTSHPNIYMPCIACIDEKESVFTSTINDFLSSKRTFNIGKKVQGNGMIFNLPKLTFDLAFGKNPFIPKQVDEKEYCLDLFHLQSVALANRISNINCKNVVIAISGGLDSTLALLVTVNCFNLLNLDKKGIHCVSMPGFGTSEKTKNLAKELCQSLNLDLKMIDITLSCKQALKDIGHDGVTADVTFENVQARMRTLHCLNIANAISGIMVGTGDLSEEALGFSTYGGDHLSSYNVNNCVSKTVIRTMLPYIVELESIKNSKNVVNEILNIPVSPELVPHGGEILQKTEEILAPYKLIDFYLYCFICAKLSPIEMAQRASCLFEGEFSPSYLREKAEMVCKRFISGQFKRSCAPESALTTHINLSSMENSIPSDSSMSIFNTFFNK